MSGYKLNASELVGEDCRYIIDHFEMELLSGKTVFVTGATGLIGKSLIFAMLYWNQTCGEPIEIIALVRDPERAVQIFGRPEHLIFLVGDIMNPLVYTGQIDYIIHGASQTDSSAFVKEPVETILTAVYGTYHILTMARQKAVKGFVYMSSMEVYGSPATDEKITEDKESNLDVMSVRSSYPESKRMCEALCTSFAAQYGVPARVIRLTQTFGPGVKYDDNRVFAEFARCVMEGRDIVLHTAGQTARSYLYTADAVWAILTVLLFGENGEAYNAANEDTYCTVYEMAELVAEKCADNKITVRFEVSDQADNKYTPTQKMNLDTKKLRKLGWYGGGVHT